MKKQYYVYLATNPKNTVLYTGVTNNLERRIYEHKNKLIKGFTAKYDVKKLIYFAEFNDSNDAIAAEKQLKNWHRQWKINLINEFNPDWKDLSEGWEE